MSATVCVGRRTIAPKYIAYGIAVCVSDTRSISPAESAVRCRSENPPVSARYGTMTSPAAPSCTMVLSYASIRESVFRFTAVIEAYKTAEPMASAIPVNVPSGSVPPSRTPETSTIPHAASATQTSCRHVNCSRKTSGEARISITGAV